jgi:hypothetical protein
MPTNYKGHGYAADLRKVCASVAHLRVEAAEIFGLQNVVLVPKDPHSPELATCEFFLFPEIKSQLRGLRIQNVYGIHEESLNLLLAIPKRQFYLCFQKWHILIAENREANLVL